MKQSAPAFDYTHAATGLTYVLPPRYRVALVRESTEVYNQIDSPDDAMEIFRVMLADADREQFLVMGLDAKAHVIGVNVAHVGTLTASLVGTREVFKALLLMNASSFIVAHNHPSGDPTPSPEDIEVTAKLMEAGKMFDIPLLDHIVVGERYSVSIREARVLTF